MAIVTGALLAVPCGVGYSLINRAIFDPPAAAAVVDGAKTRHHHHRHGRHRGDAISIGDAQGYNTDESPSRALLERTTNGYCLYLCVALLQITLNYARSVRTLERRSAELRAAARLAEIRALRYQVNPHFLFNALNSLSALVLTKRTADAERMIDNLAGFYRNALIQDPTGDVPLREELRLQQLYLAVEAVRFPDRILVDVDVPTELGEARVPGLILQPLVENAVKHGVARTGVPVTISILARERDGRLLLRVCDDAVSLDTPDREAGQAGIGLTNVVNRLAARYEQEATCHWFNLGTHGFVVDLAMPLTVSEP